MPPKTPNQNKKFDLKINEKLTIFRPSISEKPMYTTFIEEDQRPNRRVKEIS